MTEQADEIEFDIHWLDKKLGDRKESTDKKEDFLERVSIKIALANVDETTAREQAFGEVFGD